MKRLSIFLLALGLLMTGCGKAEIKKVYEPAAGPSNDFIAWSWDHISTELAEPYDRVFVQFDRKNLGSVDAFEDAGTHVAYIDGDSCWTAKEALDCVEAVGKSSVRTLAIDGGCTISTAYAKFIRRCHYAKWTVVEFVL